MQRIILVLIVISTLVSCQYSMDKPHGNRTMRQGLEISLPPPDIEIYKGPLKLYRPARPRGQSYEGPIIDTHTHFLRGLENTNVQDVLEKIDSAGVERLIVLPTPNEGRFKHRSQNASLRRKIVHVGKERAGRLCGSTYLTRWMHNAYRKGYTEEELSKRLDQLRFDLDNGNCIGIGEIGPYHFDKKPGMSIIDFPLNFAPMLKVAEVAVEKDVWLDLHAEPKTPAGKSYEDQLFGGITLLYQRYPSLKLILSHTAMTPPQNVRALLQAYPTLMMNLKIVTPGKTLKWDHLGPIANADNEIFEDWATLMEEMPDRFMVGTDARFGTSQYSKDRYRKTIKRLRRILGNLSDEAAEKIAYGNARRVFGESE